MVNAPDRFVPHDRQMRVFVSSTFRDMHAERNHLVKFIFPQLRKLCESRGVMWGEVDLRWGVTDEEAADGKVLPICLEEIKRCRPYFIGILGERYGWVPESVSVDLLERESWLQKQLADKKSVTELEIVHGVLRNARMHQHACFYFRDPKFAESMPKDRKADFMAESPQHAERLARLKCEIRRASHQRFCRLREPFASAEELGRWVLDDVTAIINDCWPEGSQPDPLDREDAAHQNHARNLRMGFVGRLDALKELNAFGASGGEPRIVSGECGAGKSALLATWAQEWRASHKDDVVIDHYVGATPESSNWRGLARRILGGLKRAFSMPEILPEKDEDLRDALETWLARTSGLNTVVLVLDALDQLSEDGQVPEIGWLPTQFPANVRLIISAQPGSMLDAMRDRQWAELPLPPLPQPEIVSAAISYFEFFGKRPPSQLLSLLESTPTAGNALYLRAVLDELRQFGSHEDLTARAAYYLAASDLPQLFERILTRWDGDFGRDPHYPDLVRRSLCLISSSRSGLLENELLLLLGKDGEPLPRRTWTPLFLAMERALSLHEGLAGIGQEHFRAAIRTRWLQDSSAARAFREELASFFNRSEDPGDRDLDVLPWLLLKLENWAEARNLLTRIPVFLRLSKARTDDLLAHWRLLGRHFNPAEHYEEALQSWIAAAAPGPNEIAAALRSLAGFHSSRDETKPQESLLRRALAIDEQRLANHDKGAVADVLDDSSSLAFLLGHTHRPEEAESLHRRALKLAEDTFGPDSEKAMNHVEGLAAWLSMTRRYAEAEDLIQRALERCRRTEGEHSARAVSMLSMLGQTMKESGRLAEAEKVLREALAICERTLDGFSVLRSSCMNLLAGLLFETGRLAEAEPLMRKTLELAIHDFGERHTRVATELNNLALLLAASDRTALARPLMKESAHILAAFTRANEHTHLKFPNTLDAYVGVLFSCGLRGDEVVTEIKAMVPELFPATTHGAGGFCARHWILPAIACGDAFARRDEHEVARSLYQWALEGSRHLFGTDHPDSRDILHRLGGALFGSGNFAAAAALLREMLADYQQRFEPDHPATLEVMQNLGGALIELGEFAEAEKLLRAAHATKDRLGEMDSRDALTIQGNLAELCRRKGDLEEAETLSIRVLELARQISHPSLDSFADNYINMLGRRGMCQDDILRQLRRLVPDLMAKRGHSTAEENRAFEQTYGLIAAAEQHRSTGDLTGALRIFREAYQARLRIANEQPSQIHQFHGGAAFALMRVGELQRQMGDDGAASASFREALEKFEAILSAKPDDAPCLSNVAALYERMGDLELDKGNTASAVENYRAGLAADERLAAVQPDSTQTRRMILVTRERLGAAHMCRGDELAGTGHAEDALHSYRQGLTEKQMRSEATDDEDDRNDFLASLRRVVDFASTTPFAEQQPGVAFDLGRLAMSVLHAGHLDEAERLFRRALASHEHRHGAFHPDVGRALDNLGMALLSKGRAADAEPLVRRALEIFETRHFHLRGDLAACLDNLASILQTEGRFDEAETVARRALAIWEAALGSEHPDVAVCLENLAALLRKSGRAAEAVPLLSRVFSIRKVAFGWQHPKTLQPLQTCIMLRESLGHDRDEIRRFLCELAPELAELARQSDQAVAESEALDHRNDSPPQMTPMSRSTAAAAPATLPPPPPQPSSTDDLREMAERAFHKCQWEGAETMYGQLVERDGSLIAGIGPKIASCILSAHSKLSDFDRRKLELLTQRLDQAGCAEIADDIRRQIEEREAMSQPKKPWWKVW